MMVEADECEKADECDEAEDLDIGETKQGKHGYVCATLIRRNPIGNRDSVVLRHISADAA